MLLKTISIFLVILLVRVDARIQFNSSPNGHNDELLNEKEEKIDYRLPSHVVPKSYKINLKPYFDEPNDKNFTFDGSVEIKLKIEQEVPEIILHSRELQFEHVTLKKESSDQENGPQRLEVSKKFDKSRDFVHIKGENIFTEGEYILKIDQFSGILNDDMRGFYRSSYKNEKGETVWLATTHFEPVGARRAFPCFDEPHLKATFDLTITHPVTYNAISNMPVSKSVNLTGNEFTETVFETTPKMSTYLLAFVVSDFTNVENNTFKVHAKPHAVEQGRLALDSGEKLLKKLEEFTGVEFTLPKMDQIAIPDFAAGAMENWGLVTYREKSLLFDEKTSTTSEKQNIVETIAHEFAHQWFGDLVSPKWWKYLWLNEGFANFFQSLITEQVEPSWQSVYQAVVKSIQTTAFDFDSSNKTHVVNQDVESPEEISAIFDSISYQKGGAIIRMMQHFLGNDVFKQGLNKYLNENGFKAAVSDDLFRSIDKSVKENKLDLGDKLENIMDSWVNRKGYPVITLTRSYNSSKDVTIEQKRFVSYNASKNEEVYFWHVPINYATTKNQNFNKTTADLWLTESSKKIPLSAEPDEWVILNKQQTGYYRVNYDERNWQLIIDYLKSDERDKIHVLNKAQLVNDALAFVKEGSLSLGTLLNLTSYLTNETDYIAWYPGFKSFTWLKEKLANTNHYPFFKEYVLRTSQKVVESVGFEDSSEDGHIDKLKRLSTLRWSCSLGNKTCNEYTKAKVEKWIEKTETISPDLKQITLCEGLRTADFDLWKKAFNKTLNTTDSDEKSYLTSALGCSNDVSILQYYLNYTLEADSKLSDTFAIVKNIRENSDVGVDSVLDFIIKRFITLLLKYKDEKRLTNLFNEVGGKITTKTQLNKLVATKDLDIPLSITGKAIEAAEENISWLEQNENILKNWVNAAGTLNTHIGFLLSMLFAFLAFIN